ncbi:FecR protein [Pedobacter steynii]|uniref:FecR protein n=1 Tax=Pedobacter steynii TaxID=430522 RepID=A0A1H0GJY2_9SPHI|nr:FecR family protein [Pedobacter steynii]NQX42446.1 FecR domain-containing protein [Pedobacter steynii]SDO07295.1 FecR protein [Pedobacter steynii]
MKKEIDKELLIRYINDRCTAEDLLQVQQFLQDPTWQQALEELLEADFSAMEKVSSDENVLEEWNQEFRDRYFKKPAVKLWSSQWMAYAAACVLVLGIAGYFFNKSGAGATHVASIAMIEKVNPRGVRSRITLPDSSMVYLGAGSSIRFPEQFAGNERTLMLSGEAFFEITKDSKRPFVIHTGKIQTRVLGTSFKITAFKGEALSVEVATGKVQVSRLENTKVKSELAVLTPGEGISWDDRTGSAVTTAPDISSVKGWARGEISFKNRSLAQIGAELGNWYGVEISFEKSASVRKRFSLSIDGTAALTDALDIICNTAQLKYRFNGSQKVIISGNK